MLEKICELSQSLRDERSRQHAKKFCGALDDMIANFLVAGKGRELVARRIARHGQIVAQQQSPLMNEMINSNYE